MTVIELESRVCPVCAEISEQPVIWSTSLFGAPDLDTRPPEMARSTLEFQLHVCPECGYAWYPEPDDRAAGVPSVDKATAAFVRQPEYQAVRNRDGLPEAARAYRCRALLDEREGELAQAGWSMLRAAWVCDDAHAEREATECRRRAVELWRLARSRGQRITTDAGADEAVLCDAARRAGDFDTARAECERGMKDAGEGLVRSVLEFERQLISAGDQEAHSMAELTG